MEDVRTAKFNAGMLQAKRIHELQDTINKCKLNPLLYNEELKAYNYELILSCLTSLYQEAESKLKDTSKARFNTLYNAIYEKLRDYPLIEMRKSVNTGRLKPYTNHNYWYSYQLFLFNFENLVKSLVDEAGLQNPPEDEDDGL